eukprot:jgi/Chlat1/7745/Chrsp66S07220
MVKPSDEFKQKLLQAVALVLSLAYFLTISSSSYFMNVPIALLLVMFVRYLLSRFELRPRSSHSTLYPIARNSVGEDQQSGPIKAAPSNRQEQSRSKAADGRWRQNVNAVPVEDAIEELTGAIIKEFVDDLWWCHITRDREGPAEAQKLVNGVCGEIARRARRIDLVALLTKDAVFLFTEHLELFRRTRESLGDVFDNVDTVERDQCMRRLLEASGDLHVALLSAENEYRVLRRLTEGIIALTLRREDAECNLVRCLARELLAGAVLKPVIEFTSPGWLNELALLLLPEVEPPPAVRRPDGSVDMHPLDKNYVASTEAETIGRSASLQDVTLHFRSQSVGSRPQSASESAESMSGFQDCGVVSLESLGIGAAAMTKTASEGARAHEDSAAVARPPRPRHVRASSSGASSGRDDEEWETLSDGHADALRRDGTRTPDVTTQRRPSPLAPGSTELANRGSSQRIPRVRARVSGVEIKGESHKSYASYMLSVVNGTSSWLVYRRYRNFETLHRRLRTFPNYRAKLPPKRIMFDNLDGSFVTERRDALDRYVQEIMSVPDLAESAEIADFLTPLSETYGTHAEGPSMFQALADNVDDAKDSMIRSFAQASDEFTNAIITATTVLGGKESAGKPGGGRNNGRSSETSPASSTIISPVNSGNNSQLTKASMAAQSFTSGSTDAAARKRASNPENASFLTGHIASALDHVFSEDGLAGAVEYSNLSAPVYHLVDTIFELEGHGWLRRKMLWIVRQVLELILGDAIDDWLLAHVQVVRKPESIAGAIRWIKKALWPNGMWFAKARDLQAGKQIQQQVVAATATKAGMVPPTNVAPTPPSQAGKPVVGSPARAAMVRQRLLGTSHPAVVSLIGKRRYQKGTMDVYEFVQSPTFTRQLGYGLLELLIVTVFPELQALVMDVRSGFA